MYDDVLVTCAWVHGQWVRIHPFVDHNGSTARLLAMMVGLRYGVPLKLPGKPRSQMPTAGLVLNYNVAAENQMVGDDQLMEQFLHDLTTESTQQAAATSAPVPHPAPGDAVDKHGDG